MELQRKGRFLEEPGTKRTRNDPIITQEPTLCRESELPSPAVPHFVVKQYAPRMLNRSSPLLSAPPSPTPHLCANAHPPRDFSSRARVHTGFCTAGLTLFRGHRPTAQAPTLFPSLGPRLRPLPVTLRRACSLAPFLNCPSLPLSCLLRYRHWLPIGSFFSANVSPMLCTLHSESPGT